MNCYLRLVPNIVSCRNKKNVLLPSSTFCPCAMSFYQTAGWALCVLGMVLTFNHKQNKTKARSYTCTRNSRVPISRFIPEKLDFVRFHHDIISCLESDSIVLSFSSGTAFLLRVGVLQFWFQHNYHLRFPFISVYMVYCCLYR